MTEPQSSPRWSDSLNLDRRLEAAVLEGSMGGDRADRWSDIDLAFVLTDDESSELVAADWVERFYGEFPVAHHYETPLARRLFVASF